MLHLCIIVASVIIIFINAKTKRLQLWLAYSYSGQFGVRIAPGNYMVAKPEVTSVPIAMLHSCVNVRLSSWRMLPFIFPLHNCHLFKFPLSSCRPYKVAFRVNFFLFPGFNCILNTEFFHFCHCVHAMQE